MRAQSHVLVRVLFGWIGLAAGLVGGWYAHERTSSWALAAFVFVVAMFVLARGVPDVITDPEKGRRIAFFGLPPTIAVGALAGSFWLWETWWLAVTIGFVAYFIGFAVVTVSLPKIAAEEHADDRTRMGLGGGLTAVSSGEARPFDTDETSRLFAAAEQSGVRLSPDERQRFLGLLEAGEILQAMEMLSDRSGRRPTTPTPPFVDKYANNKL